MRAWSPLQAGVGLGRQAWEQDAPTKQWRPHLDGAMMPIACAVICSKKEKGGSLWCARDVSDGNRCSAPQLEGRDEPPGPTLAACPVACPAACSAACSVACPVAARLQ